MLIDAPGIYSLSDEDYHSDVCPTPSLSSGLVRTLLHATPLHAWQSHPKLGGGGPKSNQRRLDLGSLAHKLVLNEGRDVVVIDADDWTRKATQEAEKEAREMGCIPVLRPHWEQIQAMAEVAKPFIPKGEAEQAFIWTEQTEWGQVWCRSKPDLMLRSRNIIFDYKTVGRGAGKRDFERAARSHGYDLQETWYARGYQKLTGEEPRFVFIAQELDPPFALCMYEFDQETRDYCSSRIDQAISKWGECLSTGRWPSYTGSVVSIRGWLSD